MLYAYLNLNFRYSLLKKDIPTTHFFLYKNPFYKNHRGSDLVKIFVKNGENIIYWNEELLQMKVYIKRIILYIRKQEKWVQRRNGLVEVQKSTRSTRHCLQIRKIGSRPKGFHWNLYSSELGAIVIRLMRRKWNHAYAQDVRIAGECWHWLISWSLRLKLSKPDLTVSRYDCLFNGNQRYCFTIAFS